LLAPAPEICICVADCINIKQSHPQQMFPNTQQSKWLLCLGVSFCALVLTYLPQGLIHFRYDRAALESGEAWRVITAHLVHLNTPHLLFNLLGLWLLCELLWHEMPLLHGLGLLGSTAIGISALLWWRHPELAWYAGLSGALHGLWAGCALAGLWPAFFILKRQSAMYGSSRWSRLKMHWPLSRCICLAGLLLLAAKLAIEYRYGASPRAIQAIGSAVVTIAHLYGAMIGVCYVLIWRSLPLLRRKK
jgi:rhomboid family GlyGly-CTERM serine protease